MSEDQALHAASTLSQIVSELIKQPRLSAFNLCTAHTNKQLSQWNSRLPRRLDMCAHELILEKCKAQYEAPAVSAWDGDFTYHDLDLLSRKLAAHLVSSGAGPERFVGVHFEKSKWTAVALLAIMRAGGAFALLDVSIPRARMQEMCRILDMVLILSSGHLTANVTGLAPRVVPVDDEHLDLLQPPSDSSWKGNADIKPGNPLFAQFTSGSTGTPKGAVISHSSYCSGQTAFADYIGLNSSSRVLQFASYAFDVSVHEILTTLMVGGCVCFPSEEARRSNVPLAISQLRVNHLTLTPTVARLLQPADIPSVKTLALVGESLRPSDIATWQHHLRLVNAYGPTECCVYTTGHFVNHGERESGVVGSGIGATCWITDPDNYQKLVSIGAIGELLIEGPIVGNGYVGDPEKTEAAFVPAPHWRTAFPNNTHRRMYRTGDLAQYVSHGKLRIIGRRDQQVKLHGQRLELNEVEHHMSNAFAVKQTIADLVTPADGGSNPLLAGFILNQVGGSTTTDLFASPSSEFRRLSDKAIAKLSGQLPEYMVPSVMIPITAIPTTRTGKADRARLRSEASKLTRFQLENFSKTLQEKRAPVSPKEILLYRLVQEVLHLKDFGMNESFFSLGGDSVLAMQLTKIARENAGIDLSGEKIFRAPVLSDLAMLMESCQNSTEIPPFSLLEKSGGNEQIIQTALHLSGLSSVDEIEDIYPCTPLQEGIMALSITSSTTKYVTRSVYQIPRVVDIEKLKHAWAMVIDSNSVLRTRIIQTGSHAFQVVVRSGGSWHHADRLKGYIEEDEQKPIQLGSPLLRLAFIQDGGRKYLVLTIHHSLYDGWSLPRVLQQVEAAFYGEAVQSQPFKVFVDHLLSQNMNQMKEFWRSELEGFPGPLFPQPPSGDHTYRPIKTHNVKRSQSTLQIKNTSGISLATMIEVSWGLTLSQYSGSCDIVFGITLAGRDAAISGIDEILGPTLTTIPLRIKLDPSIKIQDLLRLVQERKAEHLKFGHLGLQRIAALGAGPAAASKFHNLLIIQPFYNEDSLTIFNSPVEDLSTETVDNYILTLEVKLGRENAVHLEAEYDPEVIADSLMSRILEQFFHNLNIVIECDNRPLLELDPVSHADFQTFLTWNDHLPEAINCCVHDMIYRRCCSRPHAPAVVAWDGRLSYEELERYSTRAAAHLQRMNISSGAYVMIYVGKSFWTVVAILAVMKAGAAFVLVDPAQPLMRLQQIREDTQAKIVIASSQFFSDATKLNLQILRAEIGDTLKSSDVLFKEPEVSPEDAVYAVFTSGSTGKPKGVVIQHRAFITSAIMNGGKQNINSRSRVLQLASFTFDASIAEILYPLVHGGCVCIPSASDSQNNLEQVVNEFEITWATLTPSLARALDPKKLITLHTLALGGEAMTTLDVAMWAEKVHLVNGYGPAECSVDTIVQSAIDCGSDPANIGRGVAAVSWIVDPQNPEKLQPIGAPGELLVEGPILAKGYIQDPEKTAPVFIQYPDWLRRLRNGRKGRLYRTGDLVQYSPQDDGSLRYLGRMDNQVKLRGQQIELGEVERNMWECFPEAKQLVVDLVTLTDTGAQPVLAAFILLCDGSISDEQVLARPSASFRSQIESAEKSLKSRLPNYMIPSLFLPVNRIPLGPSGKTDRRQLRDILSTLKRKDLRVYRNSETAKRNASSKKESVLQQAVSTILKLPLNDIGMDDNFFYLGGDSIAAMRLVGLLRESKLTITVSELFNNPCLADLASMIREDANSSTPVPVAPFSLLRDDTRMNLIGSAARACCVEKDEIEDIYPCTPMQEALLALTVKQQDSYVLKMTFDLPKQIEIDRLQSSWQVVFDANPILRTRIIGARMGLNISLQVVLHETVKFSDELSPLFIAYGQPLSKLSITHNDEHNQLHLWLHHSLYDGASLSDILQQAEEAYKGASLRPRPFNTFAEYVASLDTLTSHKFWADEFRDLNATMFPPIRTRANISFPRESVSCNIPLHQVLESEFTLPTFIHLASGIVLGHYTASDDIVYGLTLSGRSAPLAGIESLTGPTIATVPFQIRLQPGNSAKTCLFQIQNRLVGIIPYEQTGLQTIRQISQETAAACDFQCHIVIQSPDENSEGQKVLFKESPLEEDIYSNFATSPLVLVFIPSADKKTLKLTCNFDISSFSRAEADAFSHQLDHVLQQILGDQDLSIREIDVASPEDIMRFSNYNMTKPERVDRLVHEIVFEQSYLLPSKIAIDSWDGAFSYEELYQESSRLAQELSSRGIEAYPVTAICMEKSRWTVVAILAVLQTGSSCALIDPSHPRPRMQSILQQTGANYAVTSPTTKHLLDSICENIFVISQSSLSSLPCTECQNLQSAAQSSPAFVFFTSGSTGTPKGIVIEHQSISTGLQNLRLALSLDQTSRVLQFASYAFDASVMEILFALTSGGTLCIPSETDRTSNLTQFINQHEINWAFMTPSASSLIRPSRVSSLKTLVVGGEPLTSAIIDQWSNKVSLINAYGPAECTFISTAGQVPERDWITGTIGPMINGTGWITTPSDPEKLAAWGAIGELLIEGPCVGRGYIADPEKTAASFIRNPAWISRFRGPGETRLYRTGDLVQYTNEGLIRIIGRRDRQVKLNGQRIELEEVESHLKSCFPPHATVVVELVAPQITKGRSQLCAFICMTGNRSNASSEDSILDFPDDAFINLSQTAKQQLSSSLPRYMVPDKYIPLNCVPSTGTDKINRRLLCEITAALESKDLVSLSPGAVLSQAPNTEIEAVLVDIWAVLLGHSVERISTVDNFFHIGGDSIAAMRLTSVLRQRGLQLTVPTIFSNPVLSKMASKVVKTSADSHEDIEPFSLLNKETKENIIKAAKNQCSIGRELIEDAYPCTPLQEGLISLSLRMPGAFLAHFNYTLPQNIDVPAFQKAWQIVADANPILRTRIIQAGSLYQVVSREELPWITIDSVNDWVSSLLDKDKHIGKPLIQLAITQPSSKSLAEFVLVIHHALYDGWSLPLVLDQVQQAYTGGLLPRNSFNRFISYIAKFDVEQAREYWRAQLHSSICAAFPPLPTTDYKPFTNLKIQISVALQFPSGVTNATLVQLAWALVLSQYSDSNDVIFGLTVSGRNANLEGIESLTGPTITTVPLRFRLNPEELVIHELHRLQEQVVAMVSFEQFGLQNIRRLGGDAEAACQFQNLLVIQPSAAKTTDKFWIPAQDTGGSGYFSTYALEVTCDLSDNEATITFDFDQRVLEEKHAERILSQFAHILQTIQNNPDTAISDMQSLNPSAQSEIMRWNEALAEPVERCVYEGIKEQCSISPDALAVDAWDGSFTYKELDDLSLIFAVHLYDLGVCPETFVPILAEKTRWVSIAILGVIRAGGAIVLLDPSVPFQRLQTIIEDIDARIAVSSAACSEIASQLAPTVVTIGPDLCSSRIMGVPSLIRDVTPRNALYAIFTSGSTGKPKGIVIEHAAFYTSGETQREALYLRSNTRTLQFASHMFDVSIADYLWTFLTGGCVCVASQSSLRNDLPGVMREFGINRVDLTPSIARVLRPEEIPTLKTILLGGEPLSQQDVETWASKIQLVNGYGPSECSVCCVLANVSPGSDPSNIGRAYGVVSWIVDKNDHNKLVPIGAVGELVLEGHALARGYLKEPEKTAAAFIESPLPWLQDLRPTARIYKTGDLVQYNADGSLRYVGRKDTQVKIRGQRVELGEIEHQICQACPAVRNAVVELIDLKQRRTGPALAAFVVRDGKPENEDELGEDLHSAVFLPSHADHRKQSQKTASILQKRLPSYMIPAIFIPILHMPISSSGKADRRVLREQAAQLSRDETEAYTATCVVKRPPESTAETIIQAVVAEALRIEISEIGLDDDFFRLGGDSILAIRFVESARLSGFTFKVTDVFKSPKLSVLALFVEDDTAAQQAASVVAFNEYLGFPRKEDLVRKLASSNGLSFSQDEILEVLPVTQSAERFLLQPPEYWVLNLEGPVDHDQLQSACKTLVERHPILRTVFVSLEGVFAQIVVSRVDTSIHDYGTVSNIPDWVESYRRNDPISAPTLNLPVARFAFAKEPKGKQALILRLSHAQFDGYCLHTVWRDLKELYEGASLPPPADYSAHMKQWISSQSKNAFAFWRATLESSTVSRIDNTILSGASHSPQEDTQFITSTQLIHPGSLPNELTAATVVKAAWSFVLAHLTGTHDVMFTQTSNGRNNATPLTQDVVGPCLNFIPVRAKIDFSGTAFELMQFLQRQHQESLSYELVDFRQIVEKCTPWPSGTTHQSNLVHQNIDPDLPFPFGEAQAHVTCSYEWPRPPDEILVESRPVGDGGLQITLDTLSGTLTQQNADRVVDMLCRSICLFSASPDEPLERMQSRLLLN